MERGKRANRYAIAGQPVDRETLARFAGRENGFAVPAWNEKMRVSVEMHWLAVATRSSFSPFTLLQFSCTNAVPGSNGTVLPGTVYGGQLAMKWPVARVPRRVDG